MELNQPIQQKQVDTLVSQPFSETSQKSHKSKFLLIALAIIVLIGVGVGGYYLGAGKETAKQSTANENKKIPTNIPSGAPTQSIVPENTVNMQSSVTDTGIANQKKFISPKLGVSFLFSTVSNGSKIEVKEEGNKIYLYNQGTAYSSGQYVEVFQKTAEDSLEQAIQKQFLANFSSKDCFVEDAQVGSYTNPPSSYQFKTISYPAPTNSDDPWFANSDKCPAGYSKTNGLSYFLGDTKHPKIYLFFSIGQYAILAEEKTNKVWQNTIEFL